MYFLSLLVQAECFVEKNARQLDPTTTIPYIQPYRSIYFKWREIEATEASKNPFLYWDRSSPLILFSRPLCRGIIGMVIGNWFFVIIFLFFLNTYNYLTDYSNPSSLETVPYEQATQSPFRSTTLLETPGSSTYTGTPCYSRTRCQWGRGQ